jgi:hypothetical protein
MLDPNISERQRRELVGILASGIEVDPRWLADGPWNARKVLLGRFRLKNSADYMRVGVLASEADRAAVESKMGQGYVLRWERDEDHARVYYDPEQKTRSAA